MKTSFILLFLTVFTIHGFSQVAKPELDRLITDKIFVFKAQTALPLGGQARPLTGEYDIVVTPDSVVAYLPYFGRAYNIDPFNSEGGIKFTSTDFVYTQKDRKKKGWQVMIKPRDNADIQQLFLSVSPTGYATLQVTSNNRQPISFNGFVERRQ